jgi:hypothetical protein
MGVLVGLGGACLPLAETPKSAPPTSSAAATAKYDAPDERVVLFPAGVADVTTPEASFELGYVVAVMDDHPEMHALVVGHADPSGTPTYNHDLSLKRARSVRDNLLKHGVPRARVMIAVPKEQGKPASKGLERRADVYVYDPLQDEASTRLGYEVDVRAE